MKNILSIILCGFVLTIAASVDSFAQSLPDDYDWIYGCWENRQTGAQFLISREGIRENDTRRHVCHCFLKTYPTLDVRTEPVKRFIFTTAFDNPCIEYGGPFGYERFLFLGNHELFDQGKGGPGDKLIKIKSPAPLRETAKKKKNPSLGKWELAEWDGCSLEITETIIKRVHADRSYSSTYSVSTEGYLITDNEVFVPEDSVLHHYYSTTVYYIISTYIRPVGTPIAM